MVEEDRVVVGVAEPRPSADALAQLERDHGLTGIDARRAWRGARVRAHVLHHYETALWHARPEGHFVAIDEPDAHVSVEARALPDPTIPAPIRFLPKWDNLLLAFADRTRVLAEAHRKTIIRMNGDVA